MGTAAIDLFQDTDPESNNVPVALISVLDDPDPDVAAAREVRAFDRDIDIPNLILDGKKADARLTNVIQDGGGLTLTMEGASTVVFVCNDPYRKLARSGILRVGAVVAIDELEFALVHVNRTGTQITLTFEDIEVNELRKHNDPKRAYRDKITRAEFILSLVREVKSRAIRFICPELRVTQKIKSVPRSQTDQSRLDNRGKGISRKNKKLKVKGFQATKDQIKLANVILDVGYAKNCSYKVLVAGMETAIVESTLKNKTKEESDADSEGVFQQRASQGWTGLRHTDKAAGEFFDRAKKVAKDNPTYRAWEIAAAVQKPRADLRKDYDLWRNEAVAFVRAYGGTGKNGGNSFTRFQRFAFTRGYNGKREDSWSCIQRLARDVNWRAFMWRGALYYMSEEDLFAQQPRMHLRAGVDGVDWIDWDYDTGKVLSECTVTCRFNRWIAPPGTVVVVEGEGDPVDGKWLVHTLNRGWFNKNGTITLKKPSHSFLELAPDTETVQVNDQIGSNVARAYARAEEIHKMHRGYVWGGGHSKFGPTGKDGNGDPGWDCSGAVSDVLHAGGMLKGSPLNTGGLKKWGKHGKGKHMTVWVKETSNPHESHTFIEFHMPKKKLEHWGTGDWGKGWSGAGFNKHLHPHDGFEPRHWPGTKPEFGTDTGAFDPLEIPPLLPKGTVWPQIPTLPPNVPPPPLADENPLNPSNLPGDENSSLF